MLDIWSLGSCVLDPQISKLIRILVKSRVVREEFRLEFGEKPVVTMASVLNYLAKY
jgi:hypothetical protein